MLAELRKRLAHAFAVDGSSQEITAEDRALAGRVAEAIVRRGMATPALLALESGRPLAYLGSQALVFLGPFARMVVAPEAYDRLVKLLEKRRSVDLLIEAIAERDGDRGEERRE